MLKRLAASASCSSCLLAFILAFVSPRCTLSIGADKNMVNKEDYYSATVNATVLDHKGNPQHMVTKNDGRYGQNSPKIEAKGIVIAPAAVNGAVDMQGCCQNTRFVVPPKTTHWVAIMQRGKCTFKEKILKAAAFNASTVIIYNNNTKEDTVTMAHEGTGDTVAVMITETFGKEILGFLEKNQTVLVSVMVGSRGPPKNINRGSLVFVSISFIVLMIISSAWLIFYFIQKIRDTSARDRSQRRLGDAAKKAISKLTTRTVKRGDKETEPDFNHCAVCIEGYQLNDVVRILPCKHVFHKMCVDPWLNEHCTCPMCKLNILKALGVMPNLPCVDNLAFDMERMSRSQTASQRTALMDLSSDTSISLEPLRHSSSSQLPSDEELIPRSGEINIAVTTCSWNEDAFWTPDLKSHLYFIHKFLFKHELSVLVELIFTFVDMNGFTAFHLVRLTMSNFLVLLNCCI
ncbi:E3 ubiquitin-protein ligase RNF130 isoform X1 [Xyrauchen texanus]|uniref:E3 ubiquitin-protein ligase RNF130 isoform X1 n=1 Tax=Xyrauchen texanus TaxID=154827 RepID=UPI002242BD9A|nr:E3 ubiquitin-protein ligase RNF130 isoform X1 [Xyrauchen texanus]